MFGWRRKNDGFVWSDHIRTTIKVRREDRARKIEEIKQMAADGAMGAGRQSLSAGRWGAGALLAIVRRGMAAFISAVRWVAVGLWAFARRGVGALLMFARRGVGATSGAALSGLAARVRNAGQWRAPTKLSSHTKITFMFGGLGVLAATSALLQYRETGADWPALLAGLVAIILLGLAVTPWLRRVDLNRMAQALRRWALHISLPPFALPGDPGSGRTKWAGLAVAALMAMVVGYWGWQSGHLGAAASSVMAVASGGAVELPQIKGRGRAVTGDTITINGRLVRLAGIEAPEISQVCQDERNRAWQCGQRARSTLGRVIRRQTLVCGHVAAIEGGRYQAICTSGDNDIAGEVVEKGYAFASGTVFKKYATAEEQARSAGRGIWRGVALRPAEFRAKRWEAASKSAPEGCPIKGRVVRNAKVYVLPWALDYRQVRIRSQRGERWFCSETEATNAGFRPSSTG